MAYQVIDPSDSGPIDLRDAQVRLAEVANAAWKGYNGKTLEWRLHYYSELFTTLSSYNHSVAIIRYIDEAKDRITTCGFICILRLRPNTAMHHMEDLDMQYRFTASDLEPLPNKDRTYHYFQSLWVDKRHRHSPTLFRIIRKKILDLLRAQSCGKNGRPYTVYAEADVKYGARLAERRGFIRPSNKHKNKAHLWILTSEGSPGRMKNEIAKLWTRA